MKFILGIHPYSLLAYVVFLISIACYFYGSFTHNVSSVDRLWSILPVIYVWAYVYISEYSPVVVLMAMCVTLWGIRLTGNFFIRGGYKMEGGLFVHEDFRWGIMRKAIPDCILWDMFHLFFICLFQLYLIAGFTTPVLFVALQESVFSWEDGVFALCFIIFLVIEMVIDHEMNVFQIAKRTLSDEEKKKSNDLRFIAGFNFTGFYHYSRHPNYFCEVMQWIIIYLWGSYHLGTLKNWGLLFASILTLLVYCSTYVSEPNSVAKYPLYPEYQKVTSRFIPWCSPHFSEFLEIVKKKQE